jgi:hypothetical protein
MYRDCTGLKRIVFCPICHQFGSRARTSKFEGKTKLTETPIAVCGGCVPKKKKKTKYLPGQGVLPGFECLPIE